MRRIIYIFYFLTVSAFCQAQIITTIAGTGVNGDNGDGGQATTAMLAAPVAVAIDSAGNIYICDQGSGKIRKINSNGIISTFANLQGIGIPSLLAFDSKGNLYTCVWYSENAVLKIDKQGVITTIAGTVTAGYSGNGGPATQAELNSPQAIAIDKYDNIYIEDGNNFVIRKIDTSGIINVFAGNGVSGYSGDGGSALNASFHGITSIVADTGNNIFFSDINGSIRVVNTAGIINTIIGRAYTGDSPDTVFKDSCKLWDPQGLSLDSVGQLYYVDQTTARLRQINKNDTVYTIAGLHVPGYNGDNIPAIQAQINHAAGTTFDKQGNLYIADVDNHRVRKITYAHTIGIKQVTGSSLQAEVYPNPVQNSLQLSISNEQITKIKLYDLLGNEVPTPNPSKEGNRITIDVSSLQNGVYLIQVSTESKIYNAKFIKE